MIRLLGISVSGAALLLAGMGPALALDPDISVSPSSKAFGQQQVGSDSSDIPLTVTNVGSGDMVFGATVATLSGAGAANFLIRFDTCANQTLPVAGTCTVYVAFHPLSIGATSATLSIASQSAAPPAHVPLTGTGTRVPEDPGPPRGVTAAAGNSFATVRWLAPLDNGGLPITNYWVTASPGGKSCTASGQRVCVVRGLTNGTAYRFRVRASNSGPDGDRGQASAPSAAVTPVGPPTSPRDVTATPHRRRATVAWTAPVNDGGPAINGYVVVASRGNRTCTTQTLSCTVRHLRKGKRYSFTVRARNPIGWGPWSTASNGVRPR